MIPINPCNNYKKTGNGMTLIELLVVIAIIGVLSAIAYPSYTNHVIKSHRSQALSDMARIQLSLEQHYSGSYDWSTIISGGHCLLCESDSDRYSFNVVSSASVAYSIVATAQSTKGQDQDTCLPNNKKMILKATGESIPTNCWK